MWGPKEAQILTVLKTLAPKTTPKDADREDEDLTEKEKQDKTSRFFDKQKTLGIEEQRRLQNNADHRTMPIAEQRRLQITDYAGE